MIDAPFDFSKAEIYIDGAINPKTLQWEGQRRLHITNQYEAMPWYAHIIGVGAYSDGKHVIHLSSLSEPDIREKEHNELIIRDINRIYKSLRRKKIQVTKAIILEKLAKRMWNLDPEHNSEIPILVDRYMENHTQPDISGVREFFSEWYRNELKKDMIEAGYTEEEAIDWIWGNRKYVES